MRQGWCELMTTPIPVDESESKNVGTTVNIGAQMSRQADIVGSAALMVLFLGAFVMAIEWAGKGSVFPVLVTALGAALSGGHLLRSILKKPSQPPAPKDPGDLVHEEEEAESPDHILTSASGRDWATVLAFVAGFFLLLYVFGLYVASAVFTLVYLRFQARVSWVSIIIYSAVLPASLYLIFNILLQLPVPSGVF